MNDEFSSTLTQNVVDDDVHFHWSIASTSVEKDVVKRLLERVVKLYITIRGFSIDSSVLEMYKKEGTQTINKINIHYTILYIHTYIHTYNVMYSSHKKCMHCICA